MKHIKLAVLLALVFTIVFAGFAQTPVVRAQKALVIAFVNTGSESGWRAAFSQAMKDEAVKEGIDLKYTDGQQKQEVMIAGIRAAIAQKVDAIVLAAIVDTGWDAVLKEAKDAKIPLLLVDRDVKVSDQSLYPVTRVGADFDHEGRLAASFVAMASAGIPKWANGCNIVELQGTTGASAATERAKGFGEVLALFPGLKIVASQNGDFTRDGGQKAMEALIKSQNNLKDVCAIWAHNDDMLLGALVALKAAGIKTGAGGILTVSVDGVCDAYKAMADGDFSANVVLLPSLGVQAYQAVRDVLAGKTIDKWTKMPTSTNVAAGNADLYKKYFAAGCPGYYGPQ
jgi:ABC-type sugar transport system substrate-binding protein